MKRPRIWQIAVVVLFTFLALYVSMEIPHPDWVKNLIVWLPPDQRDIALRWGLDLQGGTQVLLAADVPAGQEPGAVLMQEARQIIEDRANSLSLTEPVVRIQGESAIVVELPGIWDSSLLTETFESTTLVEFLDGGSTPPAEGLPVETTLGGLPQVEPTAPLTPTEPVTDTPPSRVYETVLSNEDLAGIGLFQTGQPDGINIAHTISFAFTAASGQRFRDYTAEHGGEFVCVALDKIILSCARLPDEPLEGTGGSIPVRLSSEEADYVSAVIRHAPYGQLPVPLKAEAVGAVESLVGRAAVAKSGRAATIALVMVLVFLILHYRLPGLLADVALLIFMLLNFAAYKVIPLPVILPSIAGFFVAAFLALGGLLAVIERLREERRADRPLPKAVDICIVRTWPFVRDTHVALLLIALVTWYIGATNDVEAVSWMGAALTVGTVTSLFVSTIAVRTLIRLVFSAAQERLSEHSWLMGI